METLEKQFNNSVTKALKEIDRNGEKLLNLAGIKMVETTRGLQDKNNNYASRSLSNKTNYKTTNRTLTFGSNASSGGYAYGLAQEYGRKAGKWPNITAIQNWITRKVKLGHIKLDKLPRKAGRIRTSTAQRRKTQIKGIAFIIARAMKKHGSKGKFYYKKGFTAGVELYGKRLNNIIIEAFK